MKLKVLKRLVLKEEFVAVTGELESALLLSQLCYWSERVKDFDEFLEEECEAFHGNEELRQKLKKHGWIRKSAAELAEEMHWAMQGRTIQRYLLKLVNRKLVDRRRQQNPKYKFDRSCEYRVNFCELQRQLKRIGYNLSDYRVTECFDNDAESTSQNDSWSSNSDQSVGSSDQTITEIRTEINLKNTIESSAESSAPLSHSTDSSPNLFPNDQITADAKASIATAQPNDPPIAIKTSKPAVREKSPPIDQAKFAAFRVKANALFNRRESTAWSSAEMKAAIPHLDTPEDEWDVLTRYYAKRGQKDFFPRTSLLTLLNNWAGEIDKAKAKFPEENEEYWKGWKPIDF